MAGKNGLSNGHTNESRVKGWCSRLAYPCAAPIVRVGDAGSAVRVQGHLGLLPTNSQARGEGMGEKK